MPTRLQNRVSAVEEKVADGGPNTAIRLYSVKGHPTDGAEELPRANGQDLSVPYRIVCFVPVANAKPLPTPLVDVTDRFQRGAA